MNLYEIYIDFDYFLIKQKKRGDIILKKLFLLLSVALLTFGITACGGTNDDPDPDPDPEVTPPVIEGVEDVDLTVGDDFDPLAGVSATDEVDGDLTSDIEVSGSVDTAVPGTYELTYSVTNSGGETTTETRDVVVNDVALTMPNGTFNYKFATPELRNTFFAAAEKYLLDRVNAGIPLFANSSFNMYSSRVQLPVDSYIPVMGFGTVYGTMSADDSTVVMDDGEFGNVGEYTYRGAVGSNPETFNPWVYEGSVTSDLMGLFLDAPYVFVFNEDKTGYAVEPSMASDVPQPVDETLLDTGIVVSKTWQMPIREDLMFTLLDGTAEELGVDTSAWDMTIDAHDFIETYKLALEQQWSRAVAGGGDFLVETQAIVNAQEFIDGDATWEEVGLRAVDDYTVEFEFKNDMSEWNVMYWLSSFVMAPINVEMYYALTDIDEEGVHDTSYGIDNYSIAYTGPYQVDFYEPDSIIRMSKNPNFHTPELYFYTHRTFRVILESDIIFQEFIAGKLDGAGVPTESYDLFKNHPSIKRAPGATAFRLNINMLGTVEAQREYFEDSDYVPEPILANEDFRKALYFGVDRETLAFEVMKTAEPMPYLFSSAYVVDPASGIPFRDTAESAVVDVNRSIDTFGYNPDLAKAYFDQAIEDLVAAGTYSAGDEIVLDMVIQAGSTSQALMSEFLIDEWETLFYSDEYDISISWTVTPAAFPNNYFDYIIPGNFDTGTGGISGSTLDAASFLNVFDSRNSSGFTLNFGKDTNVAEIELSYVNPETGEAVRELWSFDALYSVLMGEAEIVDGVLAD